MDWKVFLTTFGILFLAELGDKTQLAVIAMTAQTRKPLGVFWGAIAALALATLLGVAFGHLIQNWVPMDVLRKIAAIAFMVLGVVMLFGKF
jgi:putative Ca2+/H+ antiporter (TMEM165/GDT1 family)